MHIKKGDNVIILAGKDKGKSGVVTLSMPKEGKVVVEGINVYKHHEKARRQNSKGQVVEKAMPIHASNVAKKEDTKKKK